ncbi:hypothetical protein C4588_02745 [Candidatus Parcubacteria bacterium]|nr:MAG: hypothetical protein C4588_02745 [Candidatus Parcubacteria bacterium]
MYCNCYYRHNPVPDNYVPFSNFEVYVEPNDLIDDAILDLMHASEALVEDKPLYLGKYLMDASARLTEFLRRDDSEEVWRDRPDHRLVLLELIKDFQQLAHLPDYTSAEIRDEMLNMVNQLQSVVRNNKYLQRMRVKHKLAKIRRILRGQRTDEDRFITAVVKDIERSLKRGRSGEDIMQYIKDSIAKFKRKSDEGLS